MFDPQANSITCIQNVVHVGGIFGVAHRDGGRIRGVSVLGKAPIIGRGGAQPLPSTNREVP